MQSKVAGGTSLRLLVLHPPIHPSTRPLVFHLTPPKVTTKCKYGDSLCIRDDKVENGGKAAVGLLAAVRHLQNFFPAIFRLAGNENAGHLSSRSASRCPPNVRTPLLFLAISSPMITRAYQSHPHHRPAHSHLCSSSSLQTSFA